MTGYNGLLCTAMNDKKNLGDEKNGDDDVMIMMTLITTMINKYLIDSK